MRLLLLALLMLLSGSVCAAQTFDPASLVEGGYVLYFRHAKADVGADCKDPEQGEWWKSDDSAKTRQLSTLGEHQAVIVGQAFRRLGIPVGKVLSSEFKRSYDTAVLMNLGEPVPTSGLTPLSERGDFRPRFESVLTAAPEEGTNTVLVAHGHVLPEFEDLQEASAVVYRAGETEPLGVISFEQWEENAGGLIYESRVDEDEYLLEGSTLLIRSSRGIGEVTLRPFGREWPEIRTLRFEYLDGKGMKRLEGTELKTGSPQGQNHYRNLKTVLKDGALEMTLPPELPGLAPFLTIHWVDFYR